MHRILRFIRKNRKKIILGILIIIAIMGITNLLNFIAKSNFTLNKEKNSNIYNTSNGTIKSDTSAVSGGKISESKLKSVKNVLDEFIELCNNNKIDEAYDLISKTCKEQLYPSIDDFKNDYYLKIFNNNKRSYTMENWTGETYMVRFTEDILSTGKTTDQGSYLDYITIVEENGQKKLNINKFIGKEEINKNIEEDGIEIKVSYRNKFMDYETYNIQVTNKTKKTILLDSLLYTDKIYLVDDKENHHNAYSNEIVKDDLKVHEGLSKEITIKFDNPYITGRKIKKLTFSNIILDYTEDNYAVQQKKRISIKI